jgi:hypothetical protein
MSIMPSRTREIRAGSASDCESDAARDKTGYLALVIQAMYEVWKEKVGGTGRVRTAIPSEHPGQT